MVNRSRPDKNNSWVLCACRGIIGGSTVDVGTRVVDSKFGDNAVSLSEVLEMNVPTVLRLKFTGS